MDELGSPFPLDKISKKLRWRLAPQNAIDIALQEVFEAMEVDVEGNDDVQFNRGANRGAKANGVADEVVTGSPGQTRGLTGGSTSRTKHWP